jgi:hypothetical protein
MSFGADIGVCDMTGASTGRQSAFSNSVWVLRLEEDNQRHIAALRMVEKSAESKKNIEAQKELYFKPGWAYI